MKPKKKELSFNELSDIIVDAVLEERYLNKDDLKTKISAIISGFQLNYKVTNYNKHFDEIKTENALMKLERVEIEYAFFKKIIKGILGNEKYIVIMNDLKQITQTIKTN